MNRNLISLSVILRLGGRGWVPDSRKVSVIFSTLHFLVSWSISSFPAKSWQLTWNRWSIILDRSFLKVKLESVHHNLPPWEEEQLSPQQSQVIPLPCSDIDSWAQDLLPPEEAEAKGLSYFPTSSVFILAYIASISLTRMSGSWSRGMSNLITAILVISLSVIIVISIISIKSEYIRTQITWNTPFSWSKYEWAPLHEGVVKDHDGEVNSYMSWSCGQGFILLQDKQDYSYFATNQ